jgi:hypothetical protein
LSNNLSEGNHPNRGWLKPVAPGQVRRFVAVTTQIRGGLTQLPCKPFVWAHNFSVLTEKFYTKYDLAQEFFGVFGKI